MRRTPEATALSDTMLMRPMSPVRPTWVPPHSSTEKARAPGVVGAAHRDDADFVAIFFAKQRAGAGGDRLFLRHQARVDRRVVLHDFVAEPLDLGQIFLGHRLGMREVETQPIRRDERALLLHMVAEHLPQRLVQDVRRGVIGARRSRRA